MNSIMPTSLIPVVEASNRSRQEPDLLSMELKRLIVRLKKSIKSLIGWIRQSILSPKRNTVAAAIEISNLAQELQSIQGELLAYSQQIPEPLDGSVCSHILEKMEQLFQIDLKEVSCPFIEFGPIPFGVALLRVSQWSEELIFTLCRQIPIDRWIRTVQTLEQFSESIASE